MCGFKQPSRLHFYISKIFYFLIEMSEKIIVWPLDTGYRIINSKVYVELWCLDEKGRRVLLIDDAFKPYFYLKLKNYEKKEEIILLDVRQSADRKLGYFENSLHIPLEEILSRKDEIGVNKNIVVFCNVGESSEAVLDLLKSSGYNNVRNLAGGIEAWLKDVGRYNLKFI